LPKPEHRPQ